MKIQLVVLSLALTTTAARADDMVLVKSASPIVHQYAGHAIDVLGIAPGMSPEAAKQCITKEYSTEPSETPDGIRMSYRSIDMQTQQYPAKLSAQKGSDSITVYLGTPATGGGVIGIDRTVTYSDPLTAPKWSTVLAELDKKYGPESTPPHHGAAFGFLQVEWVFNTASEIKCNSFDCPAGYAPFNAGAMQSYQQNVSQGHDLVIMAQMNPAYSDNTRVGKIEIIVDDEQNKALTLSQAIGQIQQAAEAAYSKEAAPQQGPKF